MTIEIGKEYTLEEILKNSGIKLENYSNLNVYFYLPNDDENPLPGKYQLKEEQDYFMKKDKYSFFNYCGDIICKVKDGKEEGQFQISPKKGWGNWKIMDWFVGNSENDDTDLFKKDIYKYSDGHYVAVYMPKLFEQYARTLIWHYLKKYPNICFSKYVMEKDNADKDDGIRYVLKQPVNGNAYIGGKDGTGYIKPDIVLYDKVNNEYIILDVKYKDPSKISRDDRLQLLAYSYMYDAKKIGFIFPKPKIEDINSDDKTIYINSDDKDDKTIYREFITPLPPVEKSEALNDVDFSEFDIICGWEKQL